MSDNKQLKSIAVVGYHGEWLLVIVSALLCFGALMVVSAGVSVGHELRWSRFWTDVSLRRVFFVPVVWLVLAIVGKLDYRRWLWNEERFWRSPIVYLMMFSVGLLVLVLAIGTEVNGAKRWLVFGPEEFGLRFQPSELAKWVTMIFLAGLPCQMGSKMQEFWKGFIIGLGTLSVVVALIGLEDFGTAALVGCVGIVVLIVGGVKLRHLLVLIPLAALVFYVLVYRVPYRWERVTAYFGDENCQASYQASQSVMAIGSGGLWGSGLGNGTIKLGYVPEPTTDFIFSVIAEELGFIGCAIVVGLFIGLIICALVTIRRASDRLGRLLAIAIMGTIGAQALMNLMVVTDLAPTKGIALPFVSAGGSGLVVTAVATGVLISIARRGKKVTN